MSSGGNAHWMTAKRPGECAECEDTFRAGDRIVWDPSVNRAYCKGCGDDMVGVDPAAAGFTTLI